MIIFDDQVADMENCLARGEWRSGGTKKWAKENKKLNNIIYHNYNGPQNILSWSIVIAIYCYKRWFRSYVEREGRFLIDQIIKCWVTKRVDRRRRKQDFQSTIKMKHLFFSKTKPWSPTFSQPYLYWWCQVKSPTIYLSTSRSIIRVTHCECRRNYSRATS